MNVTDFPNFHTIPLIEMGASVVSICVTQDHQFRPDRWYVDPRRSLNLETWALPSRWKPDFFWDAQAEHGHYLPVGLGELDIPLLASFNHAHLGHVLLHLEGMFDCLVAPSAWMHSRGWGDAVLPWGASWGTLGDRAKSIAGPRVPGAPRTVDVACTIGESKLGKESVRGPVLEAVRAFKEAHPELVVEIAHGLSPRAYIELLRRSKVAVNVGTWGAQMTYRPLEIVDAGAVLVHVDETGYGSKASLREYSRPENPLSRWSSSGVYFADTSNLEEILLNALSVVDDWKAADGRSDLVRGWWETEYPYKRQYSRLFDLAASVRRKKRFPLQEWSRRAYAVNLLAGFPEMAVFHAPAVTEEDMQTLRDVPAPFRLPCLWTPRDPELLARLRTDLARREEPPEASYLSYAAQSSPRRLSSPPSLRSLRSRR